MAFQYTEQDLRIDLAAAYRLVQYFGLHDLIYTHISAKVPGTQDHFLINPYGEWFDQVTAGSLVKIDVSGNCIDGDRDVNPFGFKIHSAFHSMGDGYECVLHLHPRAGMAVAALQDGLLPMNQMSMHFVDDVAYHTYEGNEFIGDERETLVRTMTDKRVMIMRNHGIITTGKTVADAFYLAYYLEKACQIQLDVLSSGQPYVLPDAAYCKEMHDQYRRNLSAMAGHFWTSALRRLDGMDPSYRQ